MENLLIEVGKQIPNLAVLVGLTIFFLKAFARMQDSYLAAAAAARQEFLASLRQQQNENLEAHKATREVVKENTLVSVRTNECLIKLTDAVSGLSSETRATAERLRAK